jgi:putative ABC transport system substrate-binding protein
MFTGVFRIALAALVSFVVLHPAHAQDGAKPRRVGWLVISSEEVARQNVDVIRAAFAELGYREGKNLILDVRYTAGRFERGPEFANELLRAGAEVIAAGGYQLAAAAIKATQTVPVVGVGCGIELLSTSLARPSGNLTGVSCQSPDLAAKQLQLLSEVVGGPQIAALYNPTAPHMQSSVDALKTAAAGLGLVAHPIAVKKADEIEPAFAEIARVGARGAMVVTDALFYSERRRVVASAAAHRIPIIASFREFADLGALLSYGSNAQDLIRASVVIIDKILKGAKPSDLPIEQPTKFELVVNLKTARELELTLPQPILVRANEVIE